MLAKISKQKRKEKSKQKQANVTNKEDRLKQSQNNLDLLQQAFNLQNKSPEVDIESDPNVVFKSKKKTKKQKQLEEEERALTQEEMQLLEKFDKGDKEID